MIFPARRNPPSLSCCVKQQFFSCLFPISFCIMEPLRKQVLNKTADWSLRRLWLLAALLQHLCMDSAEGGDVVPRNHQALLFLFCKLPRWKLKAMALSGGLHPCPATSSWHWHHSELVLGGGTVPLLYSLCPSPSRLEKCTHLDIAAGVTSF